MSICVNDGCELEAFGDSDKCILHCSKEGLNHVDIRFDFRDALRDYVNDNNHDDYSFCHFFKIAFPKPDTQSDINYLGILEVLDQIHFDNCDFFVERIEMEKTEMFFQDCNFYKDWVIVDYDLLGNIDDVIYQSCIFYNKVITSSASKVWFYKYRYSQFDYTCVFKDEIVFYRARFEMSPFNGMQDNYKADILNKLLIEDCEFIAFEMYLLNQENGAIEFNKCSFESKLKIRSVEHGNYEAQQINKSKLKELKIIDCAVHDGAYVRVGYLDVDQFLLSNLRNPQNSELNIGDCYFDSFKMRNFRNIGRFKLYKINVNGDKKGSLFQVDNTSIGDADFQSISLTSFSTVKFFDNIFVNINYTNMQWKEIVEVGEYNGIEIIEVAKKRDTYRVLKNVAMRNNDQPQALIFYAKEMQFHKKLTIQNRCSQKDFKRFFIKDIFCKRENNWIKEGRLSDIVTLYFSENTNNFGLNWWKPIQLLMFSSVAFYASLLLSLNIEITIDSFKNIFQFVNPAHSTKFIADGKWNILSYFIDFIYRIIEGLLIYQAVVAFRKFTKK